MQKSITFKKSVKNMSGLIKKSKGLFFKAISAVLIPLLIIGCYNIVVSRQSVVTDFSKADLFDFDNITDTEYLNGFSEMLMSVQTYKDTKTSVTDTVFTVLEYLLSVFIDAFAIVLAVHVYFDKKYSLKDLIKLSFKRCFAVIFFGLFASWALSFSASTVNSTFIGMGVLARASLNGSTFAKASLITYAGSAMLQWVLTLFFTSFVMMLVFYSTIASVSGRCRWFVALQYVFEILRKKKFKQTLHFTLPVLFAYFIPTVMSVTALYTNMSICLILTCVSVIMQVILNGLTWNYAVSDYFILEKESGIEDRIRNFIRRSGQNNTVNGTSNDKTEGDNGNNEP